MHQEIEPQEIEHILDIQNATIGLLVDQVREMSLRLQALELSEAQAAVMAMRMLGKLDS